MVIYSRQKKIPNRFLKEKIIFLHIPKNAGSSFSLNYLGYQVGHLRYRDYEKILGEKLEEFFVFSIKRHPAKRFQSAYNFIVNQGINISDQKASEMIKNLGYNDVLKMLDKNRFISVHFLSQSKFIQNSKKTITLDYICDIRDVDKLESIMQLHGISSNISKEICATFSNENKKNENKTSIEDFADLDMDLLKKVYDEDFWRLGYS